MESLKTLIKFRRDLEPRVLFVKNFFPLSYKENILTYAGAANGMRNPRSSEIMLIFSNFSVH